MNKLVAKRKIEELVGRIDVLKSEIQHANVQIAKYRSLNELAHVREVEQDLERLQQRVRAFESELNGLRKFW